VNSEQLQGRWNQIKGAVKERWGRLTDNDLEIIAGREEQLIGMIQLRHGVGREEAQKQYDAWEPTDQHETEMQEQEKRAALLETDSGEQRETEMQEQEKHVA
jgi:uncharacterized protein YjbJ (UPF0337 family)